MFGDLFKNMFGNGKPQPLTSVVCPYCSEMHPLSEIFFRCRNIECRELKRYFPDQENLKAALDKLKERTVFRPKAFDHQAHCPNPKCRRATYLKICPNPKCYFPLPSVLNHSETLTIVGLGSSGKTCYVLSLIRAIKSELCRRDSFNMSISFEDDEGRNYLAKLGNAITADGQLPGGTKTVSDQFVETPSIQMTIRVPRWRKQKIDKNDIAATALVFHDPSGEWFASNTNIEQVIFLTHTRSAILLVDPYSFPNFLAAAPAASESADMPKEDPTLALEILGNRLRGQMRLKSNQRIPMDLAVVITKADCGIFGKEFDPRTLPRLSAPFDDEAAEEVSDRCRERLDVLGMSSIGAMAENTFQTVRFFAVSSLGTTPRMDGGIARIDPRRWKPKRVEDPFLWILHRWGLI